MDGLNNVLVQGGNLVDEIHLPVQSESMATQNRSKHLFTCTLYGAVKITETKKWSLNDEFTKVVSGQEMGV
ncbi:hypothetical protein [Planococcus soli]|uniref:hypothetical protein n=1 Tax=Planococcus soli TaxID=2666072 RepID=UPI00115D493A|nr:hypothetical protein [Planococcus soli]